MTSNDAENLSVGRQIRFAIPKEIRLHPKLDQASKFAWVYIWEQSNFRPDTIVTTIARIAADLGKSERAARRWVQCLAECGLIEMVGTPRRGECVFYVNAPAEWEGASPPPSVHKVFGVSGPNLPNENEDCGGSGTDPPISPISEEKNKFLSEQEKKEGMYLKLLIEQRQAEMPRDAFGVSVDGTESANCKPSGVINNSQTVNRTQCKSDDYAGTESAPAPPEVRGPCSSVVNSILSSSRTETRGDSPTSTELCYAATYEYLRSEWPDSEDVWSDLLSKIAHAVAFGRLSKEDLFELVKKSKMPRIRQPARHFCTTMPKVLAKIEAS